MDNSEENDEDNNLNISSSDHLNTNYRSGSELLTDGENADTLSEDSDIEEDTLIPIGEEKMIKKKIKEQNYSLRKLSLSSSSIEKKSRGNTKPMQPHILYLGTVVDIYNREVSNI